MKGEPKIDQVISLKILGQSFFQAVSIKMNVLRQELNKIFYHSWTSLEDDLSKDFLY